MPLVIKKKGLPTLVDYHCDLNGIATLKSLGVAEQKEDAFYTLHWGNKGFKLSMNWFAPANIVSNDLESFMFFVLGEIEKEQKFSGLVNSVATSAKDNDPVQTSAPTDGVVPLREAKAMYQRVHGTSNGSVYVVVAMAPGLNIAAKIDGVSLSMRAEGAALDKSATVNALATQGLSLKTKAEFKYMSQHYTCSPEAPPTKVIGAVLMGCGLEFDTPLPKAAKIMGA